MFGRKRILAIIAVIVLIPIVAIGWWLFAPLFSNKTVEEEFPFAFRATVPSDMTRAGVEQVMAGIAKVDEEVSEAMPKMKGGQTSAGGAMGAQLSDTATDTVIDIIPESMVDAMAQAVVDAMPKATVDAVTEPMMKEAVAKAIPEAMKETLPKAMNEAMAQAMPQAAIAAESTQPVAVKLKVGEFKGQDLFHKGSGRATIYRGPDGSFLLRLEDFKVTNGPDLRVILTPVQNPGGSGDVTAPGHVELAKLKGNRGNQNYPIPADVDIASFQSVVIYCKPFRVIFSIARLQDVG